MNLWSIIIFILPIGLLFWWMKKKKNQDFSSVPKKRHEGDEVWNTIKDFLKSNNEKGKEVVESYVAKRPDPNTINRLLPKEEQKIQKKEIDKRKKEEKLKNKELKKEGKKIPKEPNRELYVVLFVTRDTKTKQEDKPRAIECEVKNVRVAGSKSKKDIEKKIIILGERDYEKESEWILPIKKSEEQKIKKEHDKQQKRKKYNFISKLKKSRMEKIESNPLKKEKYLQKMEKKSNKKNAKLEKEKAKWEKKETVVKTKK